MKGSLGDELEAACTHTGYTERERDLIRFVIVTSEYLSYVTIETLLRFYALGDGSSFVNAIN